MYIQLFFQFYKLVLKIKFKCKIFLNEINKIFICIPRDVYTISIYVPGIPATISKHKINNHVTQVKMVRIGEDRKIDLAGRYDPLQY